VGITERLRALDSQVLGRPVPDNRPLWQKALRPRPAFWSPSGRIAALVVVAAMFALAEWGGTSVLTIIALVVLLASAFPIQAAEERKRSRRYYDSQEK